MKHSSLLAIILAGLFGCAGPASTRLLSYERGGEPEIIEVIEDGDYSLYSMTARLPVVTYPLRRGQKLGFERGERGRIIAVAGDHRVTLEDKEYAWHRR
ncbi:MAG: hypothetical protein NZ561_02040 [Phycisphaerae bacterium]|nr:hypothetical protein [Phycisphaerae bacterium]MDW8261017.1 hypothetical protein [Phycisphaerales bacterium]